MKDSSDLTFFLGAGASAPFGIPTMKQLVVNFEEMLENNGTNEELDVFRDIKNTLENVLQRPTDLEDVFTVIDGIMNYGLDRIGARAPEWVPMILLHSLGCLSLSFFLV